MVLSMLAFSVKDSFLKRAAQTLPIGQILMFFGVGALFFTGVAKLNNQPLFPKEVVSKPMRLRVLFEITGRLFYMLAITVTPFRYSCLMFGVTLGVFFDEHLTFVMVLGSRLIVILGLFILSQSKQMKTST